MTGKISTLFAASLLLPAAWGCHAEVYAVAPPPMVVPSPPPAEPLQGGPEDCPAGSIAVKPYYHWNGGGWVVVEGGCSNRPGYEWTEPQYKEVEAGTSYVPGYWKPVSKPHRMQAGPPSSGKSWKHPKKKPGPE